MNVVTSDPALDALSAGPAHEEELAALRDSVAEVLTERCDSRAVHAYIDGQADLESVVWRHAADLGWLAAALPEEFGGLGFGPRALHVLHTELGRRAAPGPYISTLSAAQWLAEIGTEEQKSAYLPRIAEGKLCAALPAVFGAGMLTLSGKTVSGALDVLGAPSAGLVVVPIGSGGKVEAWALLDPQAAGAKLEAQETWDRTRQICRLQCDGAAVVELIADPDGAIGRRLQRHVAIAIAADSLGGATNISNVTIEYLKVRVQFDKPIASFQAIKHRAADLIYSIAGQEHLLSQAVDAAAEESPDADMWAALAKAGATEAFCFVSGDCIQLHGGVGHTWEFDPHIFAKRARLNEALLADNRTMRDAAAEGLAEATRAGRITTELPL
jgi:alkylation response protein AidB-like acyl-CoA dehydrogenase